MNPSDANRVQTFTDEVVVPTFINLKTKLETSERIITLIRNTENVPEVSAAILHRMHPETAYFALPQKPLFSAQPQIIGSLYVEILQHQETVPICIGQYCLSIEITIHSSAPIEVRSIIGFTNIHNNRLEIKRTAFENKDQRLDLEEIEDLDITAHFVESLNVFERQLLEPEPILSKSTETIPPASNLDLDILQPIPLPEAPSPVPTPQSLSYEEAEAARAKIRAAQRQTIEPLLNYLKQSQKTFRSIWSSDLESGAALAQKIITDRPAQESDYQQAYNNLTTQASEFAWLFKPNSLSEFADYFELYWTMAERASLLNASQENRPYSDAFINQVHALSEPENPGQTKPTITRALRSLVHSISVKFGYPSEPGKLNWIGGGAIHSCTSIEHKIEFIQDQNEKRKVLFESLSWGVLQIYQNLDDLPEIEHKLGHNLVLSYLISAKQTIRAPTQPVEIDKDSIEHTEFRFKRKIEDKHRTWLATARVRVTRVYHRVNLYEYGIEEQ
jgi:hypothetical protein